MKVFLAWSFLCISLNAFAFEVPPFTPNIVDQQKVLSPEENKLLNDKIEALQKSGVFAAILIVNTTGDVALEEAAEKTFNKWQLGEARVDNGLLFLVAIADRRVRIEVGYGLEPVMTDSRAKQIIDEIIVPEFKQTDYFAGLMKALEATEDLVTKGKTDHLVPDDVPKIQLNGRTYALSAFYPRTIFWFFLVFILPVLIRWAAVRRASSFPPNLVPDEVEKSLKSILFLSGQSGIATFYCTFFAPFVIMSLEWGLILPIFFSALAIWMLYGVNRGYIMMYSIKTRMKFLTEPYTGKRTPDGRRLASHTTSNMPGGFGSGSRSRSSSSGGGRSGGGGASGSW